MAGQKLCDCAKINCKYWRYIMYCRDKCEIVYRIIIEMPIRNDVSGDIYGYLWGEIEFELSQMKLVRTNTMSCIIVIFYSILIAGEVS